jgi:hypothetical protein
MSCLRPNPGKRPARVRLAGSVLALLQLENGRRVRAGVHQLSITGGLLSLDRPIDEGIKVTVIFHVGGTTIRNKVTMLFPMWATQGCLQPFEFSDLAEGDREQLNQDLRRYIEPKMPHVVQQAQALPGAATPAPQD